MSIPGSLILAGCLLIVPGASPGQAGTGTAGKPAGSATAAYLSIRQKVCAAPVTDATLAPFLSSSRRTANESMPGAARSWINCKARVKVARENPPSQTGAVELDLTGTENDRPIQGDATLVKEDGAWKLDNQVIVPK